MVAARCSGMGPFRVAMRADGRAAVRGDGGQRTIQRTMRARMHPTQCETTFSWRAHPAAERPLAASAALVVIFLLAYGAGDLAGGGASPFVAACVALAAAAILILALHRFYFVSRYVLTGEGITARSLVGRRHLEWATVRRFTHDDRGGYLSTRARPSRLDGFRGLHLAFGPDRAEAVAAIRSRIETARLLRDHSP